MPRKLLIDTDTASDDAVALIMALRSPLVEVLGITVVAGNIGVEQATRNALLAVELCGASVPVYMGANKPLQRPLEPASWFHGMDGLGDVGYAPANPHPNPKHAVDAILDLANANPGLEMITLGPLTNLALALQKDPLLGKKLSRCVIMGGAACCEGNVTPAAEFNLWADPEAARIVFLSGLPLELVGWELSRHDAVLNDADIQQLLTLDTPLSAFAIGCNIRAREAYLEQTGEHGISLPDPVAMSILLHPELCLDHSEHFVEIETQGTFTRGMTVVDRLNVTADDRNRDLWQQMHSHGRKVKVCWKLDVPGWKAALKQALLYGRVATGKSK